MTPLFCCCSEPMELTFLVLQGLVIRPYKRAARNRSTDTELLGLKDYLLAHSQPV